MLALASHVRVTSMCRQLNWTAQLLCQNVCTVVFYNNMHAFCHVVGLVHKCACVFTQICMLVCHVVGLALVQNVCTVVFYNNMHAFCHVVGLALVLPGMRGHFSTKHAVSRSKCHLCAHVFVQM